MLIPGAILAAGRSSRMGRAKALLPFGTSGATFLDRVIASMRGAGLDDVLVIGRPDDGELQEAVVRTAGARFVANDHHERGQLTSIVAAVNAVDRPGTAGLMVMPVDMPMVEPATFAAVRGAFERQPATIVRAACDGRHGHPVIFDRGSFDALRHADPSIGAKAVLRARGDAVRDVAVADAGVLTDIDSIEDYVAVFGFAPAPPQSPVAS